MHLLYRILFASQNMSHTFDAKNYSVWNTRLLSYENFLELSKFEQLKYFVTLGCLAPNTHNAQPWAFSIDESEYSLTVFLDRSRVLPASDKDGRQSLVSIGAAIENIVVASAACGKRCIVKKIENEKKLLSPFLNEGEQKYVFVAALNFETCKPAHQNLYASILKRKVLRADYDREKVIDENILQKIREAVTDSGIELHLVGDAIRRQAMAEFQGQADSYVINSKKFSRELGDWLLPNDTSSPLGMPGIGFGLQDDQALRLHRALRGEEPLQPEDGLKFALGGKLAMEKSPFIGFLTAEKDEPLYWIEAGRTLERIFLTCASFDICTAVHAGIVEVTLISRIFAATLGTSKKITAVFRFGFVKDSKDLERPHSPRLPIEDVILK